MWYVETDFSHSYKGHATYYKIMRKRNSLWLRQLELDLSPYVANASACVHTEIKRDGGTSSRERSRNTYVKLPRQKIHLLFLG